jgi:hypothetical protein
MAEIRPLAADIFKTDGGAYTWSGFVLATPTGNSTLDDLILPNYLEGRRRPTYMRIAVLTPYVAGPQPLPAGIACWAEYELDGAGDPQWHMADDATQGEDALWFSLFETVNPGEQVVLFIEYGIEHSVGK